jgi:hypothetical protein
MMSGIAPELQAQALPGGTAVGPELPLAIEDQNALYAAALNDPDVTAIVNMLGEPLRIDPPTNSYASTVVPGQSISYVELPLTSYATGRPTAYLFFGNGSLTDQNGANQTLPIRLAIANDGLMRVSLLGTAQVADSPASAPGGGELLFATYFPEEYLATLDRQVSSAGTAGHLAARRVTNRVRKVMYAGGGDPAALQACRDAFRACARGPAWPCIGGWSSLLLCTVAAIAGCAPTPIWGITCWSAITICTATAIAIQVCYVALQSCSTKYKACRIKALLGGGGGVPV